VHGTILLTEKSAKDRSYDPRGSAIPTDDAEMT
jgi:hypothetical protein